MTALDPETATAINSVNSWAAELQRVTEEYAAAVKAAVKAKVAYERANAAAVLTVAGRNAEERAAKALLQLEQDDLRSNYLTTAATEKALKAQIENAQEQLGAARSNNAAMNHRR